MLAEMGLLLTTFINCYNRQERYRVLRVFMLVLQVSSHEGENISLFPIRKKSSSLLSDVSAFGTN